MDSFSWSLDGSQLAFVGADEPANAKAIKAHDDAFQVTHAVLWQPPLSGKAGKLDLGDVEADADFSIAKTGALAFIDSTASHAGELYVMTSTRS